MSDDNNARYTHGHDEPVMRSHTWRTVENSAAYLMPHLTPGAHLLDVGAGPGTISVDFARRVGSVTVAETSEDILSLSRRAAQDAGVTNMEFAVEDVHGMSFADDTFDVVHAHQVLQHVADPVAALRESDFVVLGPGSWFTSVIPHLLVPELMAAIVESPAQRILTLNIRPADETQGYNASRHLELLAEHAPGLRLDWVVADSAFAAEDRHLGSFAESLGARLVVGDVAMRDHTARHDPFRLASLYRDVMGL